MSNMNYCRFENTYHDLIDCYNNMNNNDLSPDEWSYRKELVLTCKDIIHDYEDVLDEEYDKYNK